MTLNRFVSSGVRRLLEKYGIQDRSLEEELIGFAFEVRARPLEPKQPSVWWDLPAIKLARALTGAQVPQVMCAEIVNALGQEPDETLATEVYRAWVKLGKIRYEPWGWLDYVKRREMPQGRVYASHTRNERPGSGDAHRGMAPGGSAISRKLSDS